MVGGGGEGGGAGHVKYSNWYLKMKFKCRLFLNPDLGFLEVFESGMQALVCD